MQTTLGTAANSAAPAPSHAPRAAQEAAMNTSPSSIAHPADRYAWVWLVIGAALLPFTSLQPSLPLAAWLAPVFLLRFVRTQRARVGLPVVAMVHAVAFGINWYIGTAPNTMLVISGVCVALLYTLGYAADRLFAPRLHGMARTLVFPLAFTSVDFVGSRLAAALTAFLLPSLFGAGGAFDSPGYTQAPYLPLLQVVSLTGMWGLTFLMAWFASTINALWEHRFRWQPVRTGTLGFGSTLVAVLVFGSLRLAFFPPAQPSVRVAAIASREDMFATISDLNPQHLMPGTPAERAGARARFAPIVDDLFARTEREARNGAKIIAWGETGAPVLEEDVPALIEQAAAVARQHALYLHVGLIVFRHTDHYPFLENRVVLLDPAGVTAWDYHKAHPTPGENMMVEPGPRVIPTIDTQYGRLGAAICYDMDFPELIRQAGQSGVDILLASYKDWESIRAQHAQMASFRAIENGFSIVRPALSGISTIVDPHGRVVAQADAFGGGEPTAVTLVAAAGTPTVYARIGDSFAYLCLAGLVALAGLAVIRPAFARRRLPRAEPRVAVPQPA